MQLTVKQFPGLYNIREIESCKLVVHAEMQLLIHTLINCLRKTLLEKPLQWDNYGNIATPSPWDSTSTLL